MKNLMKLLAITCLTAPIWGYSIEDNGIPQRQIKVIRTHANQTFIYDTLVSLNSGFGPIQYLKELNFSEGIENVEIWNMDDKLALSHGNINSSSSDEVNKQKGASFKMSRTSWEKYTLASIDEFLEENQNRGDNTSVSAESINILRKFRQLITDSAEEQTLLTFYKDSLSEDIRKSIAVQNGVTTILVKAVRKADFSENVFEVKENGLDMILVLVSSVSGDIENIEKYHFLSNANQNLLKISPNPNTGEFAVNYFFQDKGSTEVKLIDTNGKVVLKLERDNEVGEQSVLIAKDDLPHGVYVLEVLHANQKLAEKIVIE